MKRSPLARSTPLARGSSQLKRTPIKAVSVKQRARVAGRRGTVAEVYDRDGHRCRLLDMLVGHRCGGALVTPHHLRKQSKTHDDSAENTVTLCAAGNEWVEDHPALAHRMGLVIRDEDL